MKISKFLALRTKETTQFFGSENKRKYSDTLVNIFILYGCEILGCNISRET
jgi:hypothetical protein